MKIHWVELTALSVILAAAGATAAPDGDEILARAGSAKDLTSYSVPVHFAVRMHRPIGLRTGVEGIVYYKAPAQSGLQITKLPGPLTSLFKTSYAIDLAAQVWPSKYRVTSSETAPGNVYVLRAVPRDNDPSTDHAMFTISRDDFTPQSATWYYKDGSTVALTIKNGPVANHTLPSTETITVTMPSYALDATATYGAYQVNVPIPTSSP